MDGMQDDRAEDVLERLQRCGFSLEMADLSSKQPTPGLCTCCRGLADQLSNAQGPQQLQAALRAVSRAAASEQDAGGGRLDTALVRLDRTLDPESQEQQRVPVLERLVAHLQAIALLRHADTSTPMEASPTSAQAAGSSEGEQELSDLILQAARLLQVAPRGSDAASILGEISARLAELTQEGGDERMAAGPIVSRSDLNDQQVQLLQSVHEGLEQENALRRAMLTKRARLTLDSLLTSPRLQEQGTQAQATEAAERAMAGMPADQPVSLEEVFQACPDDFVEIMGPVSTPDTARPAASVKSVLIGKVPDRGGRTDESRGAASMPAWSSRKHASGGGGGRGRGGGRSGGGRSKKHKH